MFLYTLSLLLLLLSTLYMWKLLHVCPGSKSEMENLELNPAQWGKKKADLQWNEW